MTDTLNFQYKGIRNDVGSKFVPEEYFYDSLNINQDDISGFNKELAPGLISTLDSTASTDGIFKYNYLVHKHKRCILNPKE